MLYNKFENKTIVKGILEAVDPVHIGASAKNTLNPNDVDSSVLKDNNGNPVIPGSSIKGVVRSKFEAVLRSLNNENIRVCDIFNTKDPTCITNEDAKIINKDKNKDDYKKAALLYEKSCDVCRIFGGREIAGKLQFKDCFFIGEKCNYERRDGVAIDRKTGAAKRGAKYDFEVIPKGTEFDFMLIAENLDEQQMKYLDFIIKLIEGTLIDGDYIAVGGKTSRGMGRIRLKNCHIDEITKESLAEKFGFDKQGE